MSQLKKTTGYSISAASIAAAIAISVDRYAEFAVGAESFASWAMPPVALFILAASAFLAVKLGYRDEGDAAAWPINGLTPDLHPEHEDGIKEHGAKFRKVAE